jgi:hypothetical protein
MDRFMRVAYCTLHIAYLMLHWLSGLVSRLLLFYFIDGSLLGILFTDILFTTIVLSVSKHCTISVVRLSFLA